MYRSLYFPYRSRPRGPPPSSSQVQQAAVDTITTLKQAGVKHACFVGGMACKLFGNLRQPNDLDILCLTADWEQETLKRELVSLNAKFYLVPARSPLATYKVLWYRFFDTDSSVKVDLLFPGVLNIPSIPASSIVLLGALRLPCAPLALILLLKLQAWIHHGEALEYRYREKQPTDACDIHALLPIACSMNLRPCSDESLPKSFRDLSTQRAEKFAIQEPSSRKFWESLGMVEEKVVARQVPRQSSSSGNHRLLGSTRPVAGNIVKVRTGIENRPHEGNGLREPGAEDILTERLRRLRIQEWLNVQYVHLSSATSLAFGSG